MSTEAQSVPKLEVNHQVEGGGVILQAIALKQAIDAIPQQVESIGYCVRPQDTFDMEGADEDGNEEDEEESDNSEGDEEKEVSEEKESETGSEVTALEGSDEEEDASKQRKKQKTEVSQEEDDLQKDNKAPKETNNLMPKQKKYQSPSKQKVNGRIANEVKRVVEQPVYMEADFTEDGRPTEITIGTKSIRLDSLKDSDVKGFYDAANSAGFGNNKEMKTDYDENVRKSKEITEFAVSKDVAECLERAWNARLFPRKVRMQSYKINLYTKDDHFALHKDTPDKNLVGTAVVRLYESEKMRYGYDFYLKTHPKEHSWRSDFILFYTDVPHGVHKIKSKEGYRMNLTYKVFAVEDVIVGSAVDEAQAKLHELLLNVRRPFGILFRHEYTVEDTALKGCDAIVVKTLKSLGTTHILPVVCSLQEEWECDVRPKNSMVYVHAADDDTLEHVKKGTKGNYEHLTGGGTVRFIALGSGKVWQDEHEQAIEHTGNESQPGRRSSVYVNRAAICV